MLPIVALLGRPNVGKSTLFNRLTRSRDALVADVPGVTRDRLYGYGEFGGRRFLAVDTGGLGGEGGLQGMVEAQVEVAMEEAQVVLFLVDGKAGLVGQEREIGRRLRGWGGKVFVVVNKSEGVEGEVAGAEFHALGLGTPLAISAKNGEGVGEMLGVVFAGEGELGGEEDGEAGNAGNADSGDVPVIALAGRPNVGKSTLTNRLAGGARVVVSEVPGTTRDSIRVPLQVEGQDCVLIDTAGVRRRSRMKSGGGEDAVEKFSVLKSLQAIAEANVVLLMLEAGGEVRTQDATLAGMIAELGRSVVVVVNRCDELPAGAAGRRAEREMCAEIEGKLPFLPNAEVLFVSALRGRGVGGKEGVVAAAMRAYGSAMVSVATSDLNRTLGRAVAQTSPPLHNGRAVRLKFAHQAGKNPPVVVVHGNLVEKVPEHYRRYLANYFARAYGLVGTPVRVIFRRGGNPYVAEGGKGAGGKQRRGRGGR